MSIFHLHQPVSVQIFSPRTADCGVWAGVVVEVLDGGEYTVERTDQPGARYRVHEHDGQHSKMALVGGELAPPNPRVPRVPLPMVGVDEEDVERRRAGFELLRERLLEMQAATWRCSVCRRECPGTMARIAYPGARPGDLVNFAEMVEAPEKVEARCPDRNCGGLMAEVEDQEGKRRRRLWIQ